MNSTTRSHPYLPESPSPPGESLKELLEEEGVSQADLSRRTGLSTKHINQIIQGVAVLSPDTAVLLERATGIRAVVWSQLEAIWQTHQSQLDDQEELEKHLPWVKNFPLTYLQKVDILRDARSSIENLQKILAFFGVASPDVAQQAWREYRTAFRRSALVDGDEYAIATWLRLCEREARTLRCAPYNRQRLIDALPHLRKMTMTPSEVWSKDLPNICSDLGIALVFKPALKNTHVSGATRWLTPEKSMIALSDRFKTDDTFWFSFFHEIAHLILHGKRLTFLDEDPANDLTQGAYEELVLHGDSKSDNKAPSESEADNFARNTLIPDTEFTRFISSPPLDTTKIVGFAAKIGVSPGIVLGRLQHERVVPWSYAHKLKQPVRFSD